MEEHGLGGGQHPPPGVHHLGPQGMGAGADVGQPHRLALEGFLEGAVVHVEAQAVAGLEVQRGVATVTRIYESIWKDMPLCIII